MYNIDGYDKIHNLDKEKDIHGMVVYVKQGENIESEIVSENMDTAECILMKITFYGNNFYIWGIYRSINKISFLAVSDKTF